MLVSIRLQNTLLDLTHICQMLSLFNLQIRNSAAICAYTFHSNIHMYILQLVSGDRCKTSEIVDSVYRQIYGSLLKICAMKFFLNSNKPKAYRKRDKKI